MITIENCTFEGGSELGLGMTGGKVKLMSIHLLCSTVRVFAPATPGKSDRVVLDKCWFAGEMEPDAIAEIVDDREDDPTNNVKVRVQKPLKRRLGLAGE